MNKVAKSSMTKVITKQYKNFSEPILFTGYPPGWSVQYCLIEGIFLINTAPLGVHITYLCGLCQVLLQRHISLHFNKGCIEVHFIYDNPGQLKNTPKCFESMRRDDSVTVATTHTCDKIHKKVRLPRKWWEEVINCRTCKQTLVFLLAKYLLKIAQTYLLPNQTFYVAGGCADDMGTTAWFVQAGNVSQPNPRVHLNPKRNRHLQLDVVKCM